MMHIYKDNHVETYIHIGLYRKIDTFSCITPTFTYTSNHTDDDLLALIRPYLRL